MSIGWTDRGCSVKVKDLRGVIIIKKGDQLPYSEVDKIVDRFLVKEALQQKDKMNDFHLLTICWVTPEVYATITATNTGGQELIPRLAHFYGVLHEQCDMEKYCLNMFESTEFISTLTNPNSILRNNDLNKMYSLVIPPASGEIYQHFKGGLYKVICIATVEANVSEQVVIYKNINDQRIFSRPLGSFLSDVDGEKYPEHKGKKRMTKVDQVEPALL